MRERWQSLWDLLARWDREEREDGASDGRTIAVILIGTVCLLMLHFIVLDRRIQARLALWIARQAHTWLGLEWMPYVSLLEGAVWALGCGFFYVIVPGAVIRGFWGERLRDYGLSLEGYWRHLKWYVLLFVPVGLLVLAVSFQPAFQSKYPFYKEAQGVGDLLIWELFYGAQFVFLEFFFRGFWIHGLKRRLGIYSVFLMVTPYMMIHYGKPPLEAAGAIIAGTVLGFLSLRTRSVFGGATIHIMVAWSMDIMALIRKGFFG